MRLVELKVKVKSLAAESRIIRQEEERRKRYFKGPRRKVETVTSVTGSTRRVLRLNCGHNFHINWDEALFDNYEPLFKMRFPCKQCKKNDAEISTRIISEVNSLQQHRRYDLRSESRHAGLAYGFLCGMAYLRIEEKCREVPNFDHVKEIVKRFAPGRNDLDVDAWAKLKKETAPET